MPLEAGGGLPGYLVEIAFDSGYFTPEGDRTWTDVSDWVMGEEQIQITRGRQDERSTPEPGRLSLSLDNSDGRFTPERSASPYFPNVRKGRPIRVARLRGDGSTSVRFTGYIDEWTPTWPEGTDTECVVEIQASSRMARLGSSEPLLPPLRSEILGDDPWVYWHATQSAAAWPVPDATGKNHGRLRITVTPGQIVRTNTLPGAYDDRGMPQTFASATPATDRGYFWEQLQPAPSGTSWTFEALFRVAPTNPQRLGSSELLQCYSASYLTRVNVTYSDFTALSLGGPMLTFEVASASNGGGVFESLISEVGVADLADDEVHHLAVKQVGRSFTLYLDGSAISSLTLVGAGATADSSIYHLRMCYYVDGHNIAVGHVAVHDRSLPDSRIAARIQAARGFPDEELSDRVARLAGYAGIPSGEYEGAESSTTPLLPMPQAGKGPGEVLTALSISDSGIVMDDRDGHLVFLPRQSRYNRGVDLTLSAADQQVGGDLTPQLDDQFTVNRVRVARDDDEFLVEDGDSIADIGVYESSLDLLATSLAQAEAAARWTVDQYSVPRLRVAQVSTVPVNLDEATQEQIDALDVGTVLEVTALPTQSPSESLLLFVEGYSESITATSWSLTCNTSPARLDELAAWILQDPVLGVLGETTVVAY